MSSPPSPHEILTLQIPTSLDAQLAQAAVQAHRSKTDIALEALAQYLSADRQVATALQHLEQTLTQRLFALETKLTVLERQVTVSYLAGSSAAATGADRSAAVLSPGAIAAVGDAAPKDEIEDEPDEVLWDFLPAESST